MFSFSVSVHLDSLFNDKRSRCKLYVSSEHLETAGDFLLKIRKIFNINDSIDLYIKDFESLYYIPPGEDVRILQSNNVIVVQRNCNEDTDNEETLYKSKIKKRKRTLSLEYKNEDEAKDATPTSQVKEKGKKKNKTMNKKDLNNMSQTTTINIKEIVNHNEKQQNDVTLYNEGSSKKSENLHQNGTQAENPCNVVTHMETDQQNALQEKILPYSADSNTKDCDYRKVYNPSYSSTSFKTLGTMATSRKHKFTERKPIQTLKISTIPKLIQPVKVVDKETPQFTNKIEDTNNISDNSSNTLELLKDDLNSKSSLKLSQKLTEHSDACENREINVTKIENSLASMNSTCILVDSSTNCTDIKEEIAKSDLSYFTENFVTKRKRKRHRKKKSCVNKQTEDYDKSSQLNETPRTSVKSSTPLIHIKFTDDDHHQTNQKDEKRDSDFIHENQQLVELESNKLETDILNKNETEQDTTKNVINSKILEEKCQIQKPKSRIKILTDIKICDSSIPNSNSVYKTFTNVTTNKNNNECLLALPAPDLNNETNHTKIICNDVMKFKPKPIPKCNDKSRISTAMQRAINNYFKDLNGNGTSKKETIQHSDSSDSSSNESSSENDSSCKDAESNFIENCLKSKNSSSLEENPTTLDKKQFNGTNKCNAEKTQDNLKFLNSQLLKDNAIVTTKEVFSPFSVSESDILKKSLMNSKPIKDNIVAFKTVILTENYTPEVSNFIIAKVLDFQTEDNIVRFYVLNGGDQLNQPKGKFSLEEDADEMSTKEVTYKWEDILEPRLLYS